MRILSGMMEQYQIIETGIDGIANLNTISCVIMESDGEWRNIDCYGEIEGFICDRSPTYNTGNASKCHNKTSDSI